MYVYMYMNVNAQHYTARLTPRCDAARAHMCMILSFCEFRSGAHAQFAKTQNHATTQFKHTHTHTHTHTHSFAGVALSMGPPWGGSHTERKAGLALSMGAVDPLIDSERKFMTALGSSRSPARCTSEVILSASPALRSVWDSPQGGAILSANRRATDHYWP
jgi:hypothetical protein